MRDIDLASVKLEREMDRWIGAVGVILDCHVGEGAELEGKALDLPVKLRSNPHLRS